MIPNAVLSTFQAQEVILPTTSGLIGVLEGHTSIMTGLTAGVTLIREQNDQWSALALINGVAVIQKNYPFSKAAEKVITLPERDETCVVILVREAEYAKNLDPVATQEAYQKAQAEMARAVTPKEKVFTFSQMEKTRAYYQTTQTLPQR